MGAWKDQMEDYIIVTENDSGLLLDPSNSQKRKKSFIIPTGFRLDSEIQCKELYPGQNNWEKALEKFVKNNKSLSGESLSNMESSHLPDQKQQFSSINLVNTEATDQGPSNHENATKPFENSGYVDIQRHMENIQKGDVKQVDYSRVKEVNGDSMLILEKQNVPLNSSGYVDIQRQEESVSEDYSRVKEVGSDNMVFLQKQNMSADASCREKGNHYTGCALKKPRNPHETGPHKVGVCTELINSGYVDAIPAPPLM